MGLSENILFMVNRLRETNMKVDKMHNCNVAIDICTSETQLYNHGNKNIEFDFMLLNSDTISKLNIVEQNLLYYGLNDLLDIYMN